MMSSPRECKYCGRPVKEGKNCTCHESFYMRKNAALRRQLEQAQAESEALRQQLREILSAERKFAVNYGDAFILRKQAEAVEAAKYQHALTARIPDGTVGDHFQEGFDAAAEQYDDSLDRYAQRLRQQADELEQPE